jgi:hypothetical protein
VAERALAFRGLRAKHSRTFECFQPARVFREGAENSARGGRGPLFNLGFAFNIQRSKSKSWAKRSALDIQHWALNVECFGVFEDCPRVVLQPD